MAHRKPFVLKKTLVVYNFLQVLLSIWIFWEGLAGAWLTHYSWKCEPVDFSNTPHALRVISACLTSSCVLPVLLTDNEIDRQYGMLGRNKRAAPLPHKTH